MSDNIAERLNSTPMRTLPKTIQDAILVTRILGVRYLWVDAVCIVQPTSDNSSGWTRESVKMGEYYRNALITIVTIVFVDAMAGFLNERLALHFPEGSCALRAEALPMG
jgi:hypothetical protein